MADSVVQTAFAHHMWATLAVIETCSTLDEERLTASVEGIFGSIGDTLEHLVSADCAYLELFAPDEVRGLGDSSLEDMRAVTEHNSGVWNRVLAEDLDASRTMIRYREDGSQSCAPLGVRLAQVLHHGSDHRSQICTVLTSIGVEPPPIDVWDYAETRGWLEETPPTG